MHSVLLIILLICFATFTESGADTLFLHSDGTISSPNRQKPYHRIVKAAVGKPLTTQKRLIRASLDSLGYMDQIWLESEEAVRVVPGQRYSISSLEIIKPDAVGLITLIPTLPRPFNAAEINTISSSVVREMAEQGYPFATIIVGIEKETGQNEGTLGVVIRVDADQKAGFSRPLLYGNFKNPELLLHDIRLTPGEIFDIRRVDRTVQRLRSRPYILSVEIESPVVIDGAEGEYDSIMPVSVPFYVEERSGMNIEGALGFESGSGTRGVQGNFNLSLINIFNKGESADLYYSGNKGVQQLRFGIKKPWLFGQPLLGGARFGLEIEGEDYGHFFGELLFEADVGRRLVAGTTLRVSETAPGERESSRKFFGADFVLKMLPEPYVMGALVKEFSLLTGSGLARRQRLYTRSRVEVSGGIQLPFFSRSALVGRLFSMHMFTDEDNLVSAELYRVGGQNSVRGYSEREFAFRSVLYGQLEYHLYFNPVASLFIFVDGGSGFADSGRFDITTRNDLLGYGAGVRFPSRLGVVSLEWGRNYQEKRGGGRVHLGILNRM